MLRKTIFFVLKLGVSVLLVWFVLSGINLEEVIGRLGEASPVLVALAGLVMLGSHLLGVFQWRVFLRALRIDLPLKRATTYYYTGQFFNNFLLSSVGGDIVRMFDVSYNEKIRKGRVMASILVDRVFGLVCLVTLGWLALPFFAVSGAGNLAPVLLLYSVFAGVIALFWLFVFSRRVRHVCMHLVKRVPLARLRQAGFHFMRAFSCYRRTPVAFVKALGWGLLNQVVKMAVALLTVLALAGSFDAINPLHIVVFVPILGIVKVLPISIMGIGPHELAGRNLFAGVGASVDLAMSFLFLYQLVAIGSNVASGFFLLFRGANRPKKH